MKSMKNSTELTTYSEEHLSQPGTLFNEIWICTQWVHIITFGLRWGSVKTCKTLPFILVLYISQLIVVVLTKQY